MYYYSDDGKYLGQSRPDEHDYDYIQGVKNPFKKYENKKALYEYIQEYNIKLDGNEECRTNQLRASANNMKMGHTRRLYHELSTEEFVFGLIGDIVSWIAGE